MDFGLSEEQRLLQDTIRGFAAKQCPIARLRERFEEGGGGDAELWKGLVEMGVAGIALPGGASNIQRNVIGERGLGLPRDLRAR